MQVKEAIILAGGLGTRLREALPGLPKCMAPINGSPFLAYLVAYYRRQGIERFIFSLGYKHEIITGWLKEQYPDLPLAFAIEASPLGTGGAIQLAMEQARENNLLVLNGDTFFAIDLAQLAAVHEKQASACTLALKPMQQVERYGTVEIDQAGRIQHFREKKYYAQALINGGVYLLNAPAFARKKKPAAFSFEKDYLEVSFRHIPMYGCVQEGYFIDIGIPEDYARAQQEWKNGAPHETADR